MRDQLDHHHLARLGTAIESRLDQNILADSFIFGHHEQHVVFGEQAADDPAVFVFKHFNNRCFTPATAVNADGAHHGAITIEHFLHLLGPQKQIVGFIVGNQKTKTVGMAMHSARDEIEFFHQANIAMAVFHDLRFALHRAKTALKTLHFGFVNMQLRGELGGIDRHAGALQYFKNHFAAGDRVLIFRLLARQMGIGPARFRGDSLAIRFDGGRFFVLIGQQTLSIRK